MIFFSQYSALFEVIYSSLELFSFEYNLLNRSNQKCYYTLTAIEEKINVFLIKVEESNRNQCFFFLKF
jgi:hypothetical protein